MSMKKLITYLKLFRPASVLAMNLFLFIPILIISHDIKYSLLQTLPFILMLAGEIAFNDCCDVEKDKVNKPQRPLVSGNISIFYAKITSICIIITSALLGFLVYHTSWQRIVCFLVVACILSVYNMKHPVIALLKTIVTALATIITLSFVYTYHSINSGGSFFLVSAFFFILGRELMMDIRDMDGDLFNNYKTLAIFLGTYKTSVIILICFVISTISVLFMLVINFSFFKLILLLSAISLMFLCYLKFVQSNDTKKQNRYVLILWLPIVLILIVQII